MSITFTDDQMQSLVAKAMIDGMTPDQKSDLITSAIKATLAKPINPNSWGERRSEFQAAFDRAVSSCANTMAMEMLREDEGFKANMRSLFADAARKVFDGDRREEIVSGISSLIERALTKDR